MEIDTRTTRFTLNGSERVVSVPVDETLLTTLRHEFALMSVRSTCNIGICGACTVIVDDLPVSACLTLTALCDGKQILTAEGLLDDQGNPDRVQSAFIEHSAFQCSYCTPAMVLTTRALLADHPNPSDDEIREYLAGNLCRCGSYPHVLEAVRSLRSEAEASVEPVVAKEAVHGG